MRLNMLKLQMRKFSEDQNGNVIEAVMILGAISLSLFLFSVTYGQNVVQWVNDNAAGIFKEESRWVD